MKINQFLEQHELNLDSRTLWAKKFSDVHLPPADWKTGTTLCGTPMLGNNYAIDALKEDRDVCPKCLSIFEEERQKALSEVKVEEDPFTQLCVWPATGVLKTGISADSPKGKEKIQEFEVFMATEFQGVRVKYAEEIKTLPNIDLRTNVQEKDTGNRNDLFFWIHSDDIGKFAISRLTYGIRWWEDVLENGGGIIYPDSILEKYKPA